MKFWSFSKPSEKLQILNKMTPYIKKFKFLFPEHNLIFQLPFSFVLNSISFCATYEIPLSKLESKTIMESWKRKLQNEKPLNELMPFTKLREIHPLLQNHTINPKIHINYGTDGSPLHGNLINYPPCTMLQKAAQ